MVVKEVSIQERDHYRVQKAVLERTDPLKKLDHPNILKFYGVEFRKVSGIYNVEGREEVRMTELQAFVRFNVSLMAVGACVP